MKSLLFLMLVLTGCGREADIDPDLRKYWDLYTASMPSTSRTGEVVAFKYGSVAGDEDGHCRVQPKTAGGKVLWKERTITVRRGLAPEYERAVAIHELAHCLHAMKHVDDDFDLMGAYFTSDEDYWRENFEREFALLRARAQ